jgi:hypothetical protein
MGVVMVYTMALFHHSLGSTQETYEKNLSRYLVLWDPLNMKQEWWHKEF